MIDNNIIVLVNKNDEEIGVGDKELVHRHGILHRAFSVFVMNSKGQLLLQRRAINKYHSGGLWTNTCCSHSFPNTNFEEAIHQRLQDEMGFDCPIHWMFRYDYQVSFENGLSEHELDHIFIGFFDGFPSPNPSEVSDWSWSDLESISYDIQNNPSKYTFWFRTVFNLFVSEYNKHKGSSR